MYTFTVGECRSVIHYRADTLLPAVMSYRMFSRQWYSAERCGLGRLGAGLVNCPGLFDPFTVGCEVGGA